MQNNDYDDDNIYVHVSYPFITTVPIKLSELKKMPLKGHVNYSKIVFDSKIEIGSNLNLTYRPYFNLLKTQNGNIGLLFNQ
jgi:hypothetical protein